MDFTTAPNVSVISQSDISQLATEIREKLEQANLFREVNVGNDADLKVPHESILKIIGEFTEFKPGSKMTRYLSSGLAGHTNIRVHVQFVDLSSGKVILESNLRGTVRMGSAFGRSNHAASVDIARAIATIAKQNFQ